MNAGHILAEYKDRAVQKQLETINLPFTTETPNGQALQLFKAESAMRTKAERRYVGMIECLLRSFTYNKHAKLFISYTYLNAD